MRFSLVVLLAATVLAVGLVPSGSAARPVDTVPATFSVPLPAGAPPFPFGPDVAYSPPADYDQLVAWWQGLVAQYPNHVTMYKMNEYYGTGQVPSSSAHPPYDLWYVRVTNHSLPMDRPEVFFTGAPHGDEKTGPIGAYWFVHWWLRYALTTDYESAWDPGLIYLLDHREVWFQVNHNPDGFDRGRRGDASGRDLNRETDHDGPEPGSGWPDVFTSVAGRTVVAFMNDHQAITGMDFHGGIRGLLIPWGSTRASATATSPVTGQTWDYVPPDYELYDVFSHRMGDFIGDFGGDYGGANVGTPPGIVGYVAQGTYLSWGYGADNATNPLEDPYVQYGPYPGSSALWITPEISAQKTPPASQWGSDSTLGWGIDVRRMLLAMIDIAEPYAAWHPSGIRQDSAIEIGTGLPLAWQVNGSLVVDSTQVLWGTDPDPVANFTAMTPARTDFAGRFTGGTGWDGARDGALPGYVWRAGWTPPAPGDYYLVARAMVDQRYNATLPIPTYSGTDTYLRLVKQRAWEGWNESRNSTFDGPQTITGRKWWYSDVLHVTVLPDATPPVVTLVSPANNSLIRPGVIVNLAVQDANPTTLTRSLDGGAWTTLPVLQLSTNTWADGHHVLAVNGTDSYGNTATYSFEFDVDGTPPTLTLNSPSSGSVVAPGTVIDLSAADANFDRAEWEGATGIQPLPSPFDIDTAGWPDGPQTVTVTAYDLSGNIAALAVTITVDSDIPLVTLLDPPDGAVIPAGRTISIAVTDPTLDTVTVDTGSGPQPVTPPIAIDTTGWPDGTVVVTVTATDRAGHIAIVPFGFIFDSTPPAIVAPSPAPYFAAGPVLDFAVTDDHLSTVTMDLGAGPGAFPDPYDLNTTGWGDRSWTVTVDAVDEAGNAARATLSFTTDSTPPSLDLAGGTPQFVQSSAVLQVDVSDANLAAVAFTAANATGGGSGTLASPYEIPVSAWGEGDRTLTLSAADLAGNTAERSYRIVIDDTPPALTITPPGGLIRPGTDVELTAVDENPGTAGFTVDGTSGPPFASAVLLGTVSWRDGSVPVVLTATDLAGNTATLEREFLVDGTAPVVSIEDREADPGTLTITATVMDLHPGPVVLEYSSDGATWTSFPMGRGAGNEYSATITVTVAGTYSLRVTAADQAGNVAVPAEASLVVRAPPPPPPFPVVLVIGLLIAFVLGAVVLLLLLRRRKKDPNDKIAEPSLPREG